MNQAAKELLQTMEYAIFDLDGTLLDSMPIWVHLGETVLKSLNIIPDKETLERFRTMTLTQSSHYIKEHFPLTISAEELLQIFTDTVRKGYEEEAPLKPFALDFLQLLHSKNIPICVATASERHLTEAALKRTGVLPYLKFFITCSDIGKTKETPDIYLESMKKLGGNLSNTVIFEDSYFSVISAKKGGFSVIALYDECAKNEKESIKNLADAYLESFGEIL